MRFKRAFTTSIRVALVVGLAVDAGLAATVTIISPVQQQPPANYTPGANISVSGTAAWTIPGNSVDLIDLQVKHARTQSITNSTMVGVVKASGSPPPPNGTWNTIGAYPPLTARQATGHRAGDFYFIIATGYNATAGQFNPSAFDTVEITVE